MKKKEVLFATVACTVFEGYIYKVAARVFKLSIKKEITVGDSSRFVTAHMADTWFS